MIVFENWELRAEENLDRQQFDHLAGGLTIVGDLPDGWEWELLVKMGENMDILPLEPLEQGIGTVLTGQQLAIAGSYWLQLRGKKGEQVRHTNQLRMKVDKSLSGDVQWPELPGTFTKLEERLERKVQTAEEYALHPPVISESGTWLVWDGAAYADSGMPCRGERYELTDDDKRELTDAVLAELPVYQGEVERV